MKKKIYVWICIVVFCCGCSSMGSMESMDLQLEEAFASITKEIQKEGYKIGVRNETSIDVQQLEEEYALTLDDVQDFYVQQAIVSADVGEIAIFQIHEGKEEKVKNAILQRIEHMKEELQEFAYQVEILDNAKIGQFESYYVFVAGVDALSVLQYISSL